ncbi:MAG TPA: guanylate kinase [Gaiellaceae bacterium]|nr:guanylate kinase [Gaiellaceae bacterium]
MVSSGRVFVVTGPSGAGKGTLIKGLLERVRGLEVAVSATTRQQRPGEEDGREYWFLTDDEFTRRVDAGEFLEHVSYVSGRRYGTLRSEMQRIAAEDGVCVLELELEGALRVQREVPGSVTIFVAADVAELERRLLERATESTGEIGERIALARSQLEQAHRFRYMVRNDDLERATAVLAAIVERELELRARTKPALADPGGAERL